MRISVRKFMIAGAAICCYLTSPYYQGSLRPWIDEKTGAVQDVIHEWRIGMHGYADTLVAAARVRRQVQEIERELEQRNPETADVPQKTAHRHPEPHRDLR